MLPRLVPEISPLYAFFDVVGAGVVVVGVVGVGIEDSRSWMPLKAIRDLKYCLSEF